MNTYAVTYDTPDGVFRTLCTGLKAAQELIEQLQAEGRIVRDVCIVA